MTGARANGVAVKRLVRELRSRVPAGCPVGPDAWARGMVDSIDNDLMPHNAPRGDIGRLENVDIAEGCGWLGDADEFVAIMVKCGIFAEHAQHRLVVVDAHVHAANYIRGKVKQLGGFVTEPTPAPTSAATDDTPGDTPRGGLGAQPRKTPGPASSYPSHSLPSPSISSIDRLGDRSTDNLGKNHPEVTLDEWRAAVDDLLKAAEIARVGPDRKLKDRSDLAACVLLARRQLPPGEFDAALSRCKEHLRRRKDIENPLGFVLKTIAESLGAKVHEVAAALSIPEAWLQPKPDVSVQRRAGHKPATLGALNGVEVEL